MRINGVNRKKLKSFCIATMFMIQSCTNSDRKMLDSRVDYYEKCRLLCLSENKPGVSFFFKRSGETIDELTVTLLGTVVTGSHDSLRIVNSINMFGAFEDVKNGNGRLFVYGQHDQALGYYYLGAAWAVPKKLIDGKLLFDYNNDLCDQPTTISLSDSIPKQIFINCTPHGGDLYSFTSL
jgi:hypothetical protein